MSSYYETKLPSKVGDYCWYVAKHKDREVAEKCTIVCPSNGGFIWVRRSSGVVKASPGSFSVLVVKGHQQVSSLFDSDEIIEVHLSNLFDHMPRLLLYHIDRLGKTFKWE